MSVEGCTTNRDEEDQEEKPGGVRRKAKLSSRHTVWRTCPRVRWRLYFRSWNDKTQSKGLEWGVLSFRDQWCESRRKKALGEEWRRKRSTVNATEWLHYTLVLALSGEIRVVEHPALFCNTGVWQFVVYWSQCLFLIWWIAILCFNGKVSPRYTRNQREEVHHWQHLLNNDTHFSLLYINYAEVFVQL